MSQASKQHFYYKNCKHTAQGSHPQRNTYRQIQCQQQSGDHRRPLARRVRRSATADDEQAGSEPDQLVSGPFVLDEKSRVLYKSGKPIDLTQVEFQIMELFFRNPGTALVREKILEGVWGKGYFGDVKIVDVNIRRLRMKVEDEPSSPQHILTVWGYGYRWNA